MRAAIPGMPVRQPRRTDSGHTLIEMMVVISLLTVVVIAVGTLSVAAHRTSSTLQDRLDTTTQGQIAIDATSKMLRTSVMPKQLSDSACDDCEERALIQATGSQIQFYANLGDPVGPSLVTLRVERDPNAAHPSAALVQTVRSPKDLGNGRYTFVCTPSGSTCRVTTRVLTRGLAWPADTAFTYYDFQGDRVTAPSLTTDDLGKVTSVEVILRVQNHRGADDYPGSTVVKRVRLPNADYTYHQEATP